MKMIKRSANGQVKKGRSRFAARRNAPIETQLKDREARRKHGLIPPFSSTKQDNKAAERLYMKVVNGFEIMQMRPRRIPA